MPLAFRHRTFGAVDFCRLVPCRQSLLSQPRFALTPTRRMSAAPSFNGPAASASARHALTAAEYAGSGFGTKIIHIGSAPDPVTGAVVPPISLSTTFAQASPGVAQYEYSRSANPSREAFEAAAAAAEGGKHCMSFASGLAASTTILHMFKTGDHIISIDDVYGGTQRLFRRVANPVAGMEFSFVDFNNTAELEAAFKPNTKMLWLETPTNPTMKISDIEAVAKLAHSKGAILVVDNTFATPFFQNPLKWGADIVIHSITKYINGHSDVVGGIVITSDEELHAKLRFLQNSLGAVPSPFDCYLALRGLKTLHVRMERHASNAMAVAQFLEAHAAVEKVYYPGLKSHPQHDIAAKQMVGGFGGMITFYIKGGIVGARAFLENVKIFTCAESLGAVESLAESPAVMTHASVPAEMRAKLGISDSLVRLSVGIENIEDLIADLKQALKAAEDKVATA